MNETQERLDVAAAVRAELGRRSKSQTSLARDMGVSQMWLNRRLRGEVALSVDDLAAIAQALQMPVERLLKEA